MNGPQIDEDVGWHSPNKPTSGAAGILSGFSVESGSFSHSEESIQKCHSDAQSQATEAGKATKDQQDLIYEPEEKEAPAANNGPQKIRESEPLEYKKARSVPVNPYILPPLKVICYKKFPVGTVMMMRHQEFSLDPKAPEKMRTEITGTHSFIPTEGGMICVAWRPVLVVYSSDETFQYIPLRTSNGKGLRSTKHKNRVKYLRLEARGENLKQDTSHSPHPSIKFDHKEEEPPWGEDSYLNVDELYTSFPIPGIRFLGKLCSGENVRVDALINTFRSCIPPPLEARLDNSSIDEYFSRNSGGARIADLTHIRSDAQSSDRPSNAMLENNEQRGNDRDGFRGRRDRSPPRDLSHSGGQFRSRNRRGRSRSRSPSVFRHGDSGKDSRYRDRSRPRIRK